MSKYVIIDAEAIQKKIEELEKTNEVFKHAKTHNPTMAACEATLSSLKRILSQSTPLIPEIEKAFDEGAGYFDITLPVECKKEYISNLKIK